MPGRQQLAEAGLVGALWGYAATVLYPAQVLRRSGVAVVGPPVGDAPEGLPRQCLGRSSLVRRPGPVLLAEANPHQHLVEEFDRLAELYELLVAPFATPIFDEALDVSVGTCPAIHACSTPVAARAVSFAALPSSCPTVWRWGSISPPAW